METGAQALALGVSPGGCWAIKADSGQVMGTVEGSDSSDVLAKYLCSHFLLACSSRPGSAIDVVLLPWPQPWVPPGPTQAPLPWASHRNPAGSRRFKYARVPKAVC